MVSQSEIRASDISGLFEKVNKGNYGKYLRKLVLKHMRGFTGEPVTFDFPVTAIIGPNGGGKTTVLGAAGSAYKQVPPRRFFAKSGKYDESMQNWEIEYEIIDRAISPKDVVKRVASFQQYRWRRDALDRDVLVFGVTRTVPASESRDFVRCASNKFVVPDNQIEALSTAVCVAVSRILGKNIDGFQRLKLDKSGRITFLTGKTKGGTKYSEFHFGAGESSIIKMVSQIELAEEQSLVLIEEIENGLHPIATVRMVEYLIDVAMRKKIQTIFTTHSNEALRPLPSKAIWVTSQDKVFQGKLDIESLRAITGQVDARLVIFVEDKFAKAWVEAMIRQTKLIPADAVQVHPMEGDGTAVGINKHHRKDPSAIVPSVCIIDGDSHQLESEIDKVFRLPGQCPESYVYDEVLAKWPEFGGKMAVALLQRFEDSEKIKVMLEEIRTTNLDPHLLFSQVGQRLGLIPETTVVGAFTTIWAQAYAELAERQMNPLKAELPTW